MPKINFYYAFREEFPFVAKYDGWATPPINPRLEQGGVVGHSSRTYSELMRNVFNDLMGYSLGSNAKFPELALSDKFKEKIGPDLELFTRELLSEGLVKLLMTDEDMGKLFDEGKGLESYGCRE
ncbi:hypothetical protein HYT23_01795 [Candidatus Pacearchaeota archaeon]|nr:hypothetical protein [Candidatus Pacearchaeota archaeon]